MNQQTPKVSLIVPVYKVEKYLDKCVKSLLGQTLQEIEIILVDDGSPDNCPAMCEEYARRDSRIKVIHKENGGLSSARNKGLNFIKGEYFMFVDSDDWLDTETCEVSYIEAKSSDADCLMFSYTKEFGDHSIVNHIFDSPKMELSNEEIKEKIHRRLFGPVGEELSKPQNVDLIVSACMQLFRTDKFQNVRFVDTQIIGTEDCWYQILIYGNCEKFVYIDRPFYHYLRINDGSLTTKYNPHLFSRWQTLYDYMKAYISENHEPGEYEVALKNRIALSIIGAGLNQTRSNDRLADGAKHIGSMLETSRYTKALDSLDTSLMPLHWKVFFILAKNRMTLTLFTMLKMIEFLRTHKR